MGPKIVKYFKYTKPLFWGNAWDLFCVSYSKYPIDNPPSIDILYIPALYLGFHFFRNFEQPGKMFRNMKFRVTTRNLELAGNFFLSSDSELGKIRSRTPEFLVLRLRSWKFRVLEITGFSALLFIPEISYIFRLFPCQNPNLGFVI